MNGNNNKLIIAFGKGRLFKESINSFNLTTGNNYNEFASSKIPIYDDIQKNLTCLSIRNEDLTWMLQKKYTNAAIGSSLWFLNESDYTLKKAITLKTKTYRLALISRKGVEINSIKKIATRFVNITNSYFKDREQEVEVIKMNGSHEIALSIEMADAIVDVVETGETIRKMGLHQLDLLHDLHHGVWLRDDKDYESNLNKVKSLVMAEHILE